MSGAKLLLVCLACVLIAWSMQVSAESKELSVGMEASSFLEAAGELASEAMSETSPCRGCTHTTTPAIVERAVKRRRSGPATVQRGGRWRRRGPDMRKGTADGSVLPPWDPFRIHKRQERRLARSQAKRQAQVDKETQRDNCRKARAREKRRLAIEARERKEEEEERKREAARKKEEDFSFLESEATVDAELQSLSQQEADIDTEMMVDAEQEEQANIEADADAEEAQQDLAEMESELEDSSEAEAETEEDSALVERKDEIVIKARTKPRGNRHSPSLHVTYNREDLLDESFDNKGSRAVFKRRARGQEIVRFHKRLQSDAGLAVVNGVTKMPCGREITDKGLFQPVVRNHLTATVEAAEPNPPVWRDDNIAAIKAFPVVPQYKSKGGLDEYGDPIE
jgi:hypothetical protein